MTFTKNDTLVAKGVAVILLLIHHLFYSMDYNFSSFLISKEGWVDLAKIGKVCVAMFLILSGYGLCASYKTKSPKLLDFYKHNYGRLYKEFLPVSIIFVSLILYLNDWNLEAIYGEKWKDVTFRSLLGISYFYNEDGINGSWWFVSLVIVLYFLFPLLYRIICKYPYETLAVSLLLFYTPPHFENYGAFSGAVARFLLLRSSIQGYLTYWLAPFVLGIVLCRVNFFENLYNWKYQSKSLFVGLVFVILAYFRLCFLKGSPAGWMTWIDGFIALSLICYVWLIISGKVKDIFAFIGKHSMNIYFVHIFIIVVFFKEFSYALKYPPLILLQLLLVCLGFSIVLEKCKQFLFVGIEKYQKKCFK